MSDAQSAGSLSDDDKLKTSVYGLSDYRCPLRVVEAVYDAGIHTIGDLRFVDENRLMAIDNISTRSVQQLKRALRLFLEK